MNRMRMKISAAMLCGLLVWVGANTARGDAPATTQAMAIMPTTATSGPAMTAAGASAATTSPSASSAPQPFIRSADSMLAQPSPTLIRVPPMPREYQVLLTRSMFVRGHMADRSHITPPGGYRVTETTRVNPTRAETELVFNGVTKTGTGIDALVEDTNSGRVMTLHNGDAVARGTVGAITMDKLEYKYNGRVLSILIGQNFTGSESDIPSVAPTTGPSAPSGLSSQDILEKLRQKRMSELGGSPAGPPPNGSAAPNGGGAGGPGGNGPYGNGPNGNGPGGNGPGGNGPGGGPGGGGGDGNGQGGGGQ